MTYSYRILVVARREKIAEKAGDKFVTVERLLLALAIEQNSEASRALARSLVAQLHVVATGRGLAGPSAILRGKLVERLLVDWNQHVLGLSDFFFHLVKRAGTRFIRTRRNAFNAAAAFPRDKSGWTGRP